MLKKIFERLNKDKKAIAILVLALIVIAGCMETLTPTDNNKSKLTVNVVLIANQDTSNPIPLKGQDVKIFDMNDRKTALQQGITDDFGKVVFDLNTPKVGQNVYVETIHNGDTLKREGVLVCIDAQVTFMFFDSTGCKSSCPTLQRETFPPVEFGATLKGDTVSNRGDYKVLVSASSQFPNTVDYVYTIQNPDSACASVVVNINLDTVGDKQHENARNYKSFKVTPSGSFTLNPGDRQDVRIEFTAPTRTELDSIVNYKKQNNKTDSILSFRISFTVNGRKCSQVVDLSAVMISIPDLSPVINLRAFRQITKQVPIPDNEVYFFGRVDKDIYRHKDKSPITERPPLSDEGDIYIDVNNNDSITPPPQPPILMLSNPVAVEGMKLWKSNYKENQFVNVVNVNNDFMADGNRASGYTKLLPNPLNPGDVIAIKFGGSIYALLYIREVKDGSGNNTSGQSGIEFRAMFPVIAP